jgi:voltage-gated potassium channel
MSRRGLAYVLALTAVILPLGATGMYTFEKGVDGPFSSFSTSLWWTAMVLTTMGSEAWPKSAEGRVLCLFLAVYAFAVFGYVTAALATFFLGQEGARARAESTDREELAELRCEIAALRADLRGAVTRSPGQG